MWYFYSYLKLRGGLSELVASLSELNVDKPRKNSVVPNTKF